MHQDMGALGNGFIETQACQDKRMPPKAPAVIHSRPPQPRFLEARLDPARRGAGLRWDNSFGQQGQAMAATAPRSPGAAGKEMLGFKPLGGLLWSRWDKETEGFNQGHARGPWQRRRWPHLSWNSWGAPAISSIRDFFAKQAKRARSAFY